MNIKMRRAGMDQIMEIPEEQRFTYQALGFLYLGPVEEPKPEPKPKPASRKK